MKRTILLLLFMSILDFCQAQVFDNTPPATPPPTSDGYSPFSGNRPPLRIIDPDDKGDDFNQNKDAEDETEDVNDNKAPVRESLWICLLLTAGYALWRRRTKN